MIGMRILLLSSGQGRKMQTREVSVRPVIIPPFHISLIVASLLVSERSLLLPRCFGATVNHAQVKGENG